ncbi:hypothetical protein [Zavarzinia aquatilis]|uniref:Uncharacterized protein n=1 Tax=Zavarzinia aquatilis TaxID=2211142 RepID=A0A317EDZ3_9PROT|nr:hypothetical protein [Zavarzinia aquatilis]PWR24484.1 hypothetical protein DKG74_06670 [Zavarzinia aquatilis]
MTVSVWSAFTFAVRNTIRPVTLGFVGLQLAGAAAFVMWTKVRIAQLAALNDPAAWQSYAWQTGLLNALLSLLSLPVFVILASRLSADIFGRPFPVTWWRGSLRALKVVAILFVALVVILLPGMLLQAFVFKVEETGPLTTMLLALLPMLVALWCLFSHIFYGYGVMFKGRFGFRQARAYARGRRLRLVGGMVLLLLVTVPFQLLLRYEPIQPMLPIGSFLALSALSSLLGVAVQVLVLREFLEAMDEADARAAESPPPEIATTAFEG